MSVLDNSVMWSKSVLRAKCKTCHKIGIEDQLLICDMCNGNFLSSFGSGAYFLIIIFETTDGYHTYCLVPKLKTVPSGDWFCGKCAPKKTRTPAKRRAQAAIEDTEDVDEVCCMPSGTLL